MSRSFSLGEDGADGEESEQSESRLGAGRRGSRAARHDVRSVRSRVEDLVEPVTRPGTMAAGSSGGEAEDQVASLVVPSAS